MVRRPNKVSSLNGCSCIEQGYWSFIYSFIHSPHLLLVATSLFTVYHGLSDLGNFLPKWKPAYRYQKKEEEETWHCPSCHDFSKLAWKAWSLKGLFVHGNFMPHNKLVFSLGFSLRVEGVPSEYFWQKEGSIILKGGFWSHCLPVQPIWKRWKFTLTMYFKHLRSDSNWRA